MIKIVPLQPGSRLSGQVSQLILTPQILTPGPYPLVDMDSHHQQIWTPIFIIAEIYITLILRYVIARILRHMCNLHIKEKEISNKKNLILGFNSPILLYDSVFRYFHESQFKLLVYILYTMDFSHYFCCNTLSQLYIVCLSL